MDTRRVAVCKCGPKLCACQQAPLCTRHVHGPTHARQLNADFDSPRWRKCPLEVNWCEGPSMYGDYLSALDRSLAERIVWLLITDSIKCVRHIIALGMTCSRLRCAFAGV